MMLVRDLVKRAGAGGPLVPFFKAVCVYFAMGAGGGAPSLAAVALKCAPVLCLLLCVVLKCSGAPGERGRYARWVCVGLALSAAGDAALVWPQRLAAGMALFGAAHVAYVLAFGLRPRCSRLAALSALAAALYVRTLRPGALAALAPAVHVYAALLAAMAWRGAARPGPQRAGALLFALSDALLGYSLFGGPVPYKQVLVMSTYYTGQLLIALSALQQPEEPRQAF
ncbi:lysoplasmalogenase TMEM86A [Battus philenor]|uniref:lysoplasmalogenase TMEM86A n=1 Tax=Battus philenor TaxID=42288 RepID=UPI0035CF1FBA